VAASCKGSSDKEKFSTIHNTLEFLSCMEGRVLDSFGALHAFVQAADTGGFTEAGRKLGVTASAVS
jgi:hypothetical protein